MARGDAWGSGMDLPGVEEEVVEAGLDQSFSPVPVPVGAVELLDQCQLILGTVGDAAGPQRSRQLGAVTWGGHASIGGTPSTPRWHRRDQPARDGGALRDPPADLPRGPLASSSSRRRYSRLVSSVTGPGSSPSARSRRRRVSSERGRGGTVHACPSWTVASLGLVVASAPGLCHSVGARPRSSSSRCSAERWVPELAGESGTAGLLGSTVVLPGCRGAGRRLKLPWGHGGCCVPKVKGSCHPEPPFRALGMGLPVARRGP